ncbi:MAG: hypothetical protein CL398_05675 [Acidiferrobacteraceae bacterium]|nr:hypothetical protein [Acidiferrobacteraceae bacterium]
MLSTAANTQLDDTQVSLLRTVAGDMIPCSEQFQVPGADDDMIFNEILVVAQRECERLIEALRLLELSAQKKYSESFISLKKNRRIEIIETELLDSNAECGVIRELILQCYYRDDRVLRSLGVEPRAPFPDGYDVEESDWSLLEPVLRRGKIYR